MRSAQLGIAAVFAASGAGHWYSPGFNGIWFAPATMTLAESRLVGAVMLVGAAILFFMNPSKPK